MKLGKAASVLAILCASASLATPQDVDYDTATGTGERLASQAIANSIEIITRSDIAIECGYILIADGDSWFDYPLRRDIITELERKYWAVLSAAHRGDTLEEMVYDSRQIYSFYRVLSRAFHYTNVIDYDRSDLDCKYDEYEIARDAIPKAILLSAGGNDILGGLFAYLLEHGQSSAGELLNKQMVAGLFYRLERTLVEYISAIRYMCLYVSKKYMDDDTHCEKIPIFVHGYDYAQATGQGYELFLIRLAGPWITPALALRGRDAAEGNAAVRYLVDAYNQVLCHVADTATQMSRYNPVFYFDFRNAVGSDWRDEIHPNAAAAERLATDLSQAVIKFHTGNLLPTSCRRGNGR